VAHAHNYTNKWALGKSSTVGPRQRVALCYQRPGYGRYRRGPFLPRQWLSSPQCLDQSGPTSI